MKLLLVDDEPLARDRLKSLLAEIGDCEVVGEAGNGREALDQVQRLQPDALLLDISMPVMDGLEAARHLAKLPQPPKVIFCTAYDEHALQAFEAAAIDYLVKPVRKERLQQALQRVRSYAGETPAALPEGRRSHISARLRGSLRLIPIEDIHYLQAEEKYVVVHHARGEDLIEESLKSLEQEFAEQFLRIHRNCLVATREIVELHRSPDGHVHARLRHGAELEVSRRCLPALRERLKHL